MGQCQQHCCTDGTLKPKLDPTKEELLKLGLSESAIAELGLDSYNIDSKVFFCT